MSEEHEHQHVIDFRKAVTTLLNDGWTKARIEALVTNQVETELIESRTTSVLWKAIRNAGLTESGFQNDEIANTIIKLPEVKELLKLQQKAEQDAAKAPHFTPPRPGAY